MKQFSLSIRQQLCIGFGITMLFALVFCGITYSLLGSLNNAMDAESIMKTVDLTRMIMTIFFLVLGIAIITIVSVLSYTMPRTVLKPVKSAAEQMIATAGLLSSSTLQASDAADQNASVAQQLAAGAIQQSRQSGEISKTIVSMSAAISQMSASAQDVAALSTQTSQLAQKAGEGAEKSNQDLTNIKNVFANTSGMVKQLTQSSGQIAEIVDTINSIADQTNLLALNAAIEAARAGEAGRGFAVVADEVRKLSEGSAKAAQEIKLIVKNMSSQMDDATSAVEAGGTILTQGVETINQTLSLLQDIASSVSKVSAKTQELSAGTQQQSAATQQIAKTMDGIAAVSEQNASASQQVSASTQQQSAANQQISAAAQQLQALALDLQHLVGGLHAQSDQQVMKIPVPHADTPASGTTRKKQRKNMPFFPSASPA